MNRIEDTPSYPFKVSSCLDPRKWKTVLGAHVFRSSALEHDAHPDRAVCRLEVDLGNMGAYVVSGIFFRLGVYAILAQDSLFGERTDSIPDRLLDQEYVFIRTGLDKRQQCSGILTDGEPGFS
jgi:hypothetical protein